MVYHHKPPLDPQQAPLPNPPKAPAVEQILWEIFGRKAGEAVLRGEANSTIGPRRLRSGLVQVARSGALGVRVQTGPVCLGLSLSDDDERVLAAVGALPALARALVIAHAKTASRPDLAEQPVRFRPVRTDQGRPLLIYRDPTDRRHPLCCLVEPHPSPAQRDFLRQRWLIWWDALATIATYAGCQPPTVPRHPWE